MQPNMEVMTIDRGNGGDLSLSRPAETVLKEAQMVAGPWGKQVESLTLFKMIGPSKHLYIEAWQMLGAMYRVTARVRETRFVDMGEVKGWEATAEAYHIPTGQILSTADAMCLSDEENWGPRPKYEFKEGKRVQIGYVGTPLQQLRSMAQTRACSKVLSNLFKWVARMKGYQGTPAEEMGGEGEEQPQTGSSPKRKSEAKQEPQGEADPNIISEGQAKRMYAIAVNECKLTRGGYEAFLKSYGFDNSRAVTKARYDEMINALQMGKDSTKEGA